MSEEKNEDKVCSACVSVRPGTMLCRSWAVSLLLLMPLSMALAWWYDANSQKWNHPANMIATLALAVMWLRSLYLYLVFVVLGRKYFVWLDAADHLHVHRTDWWQKLFNGKEMQLAPLPAGSVFEIWTGGWFRHSKVLDGDKHFGWNIKVTGTWFSFLPKWLVLTDFKENSLRLAFSRLGTRRELDQECIWFALRLVSEHQSLADALHELENRRETSTSAVAGHVRTNV